MDNQQYDHLIDEISSKLANHFLTLLLKKPEFRKTVDTSPLLNFTISTYMQSLFNVLNAIEKMTLAEVELIQNIKKFKESIVGSINALPFIKEFILKDD